MWILTWLILNSLSLEQWNTFFNCLQACQEAAQLTQCPTNKESWLANCNTAVTLSERYSSPQGNLKRVAEMLKIEESC